MTTLYLDTEFNGYRGSLISMALVPDDPVGPEWYEVCDPSGMVIVPWVKQHVLPKLGRTPLSHNDFQASFESYILGWTDPLVIVADWPEDFVHFCHLIAGPNGGQVDVWPTFRLVHVETRPKIPHNALSDARALRDACERAAA